MVMKRTYKKRSYTRKKKAVEAVPEEEIVSEPVAEEEPRSIDDIFQEIAEVKGPALPPTTTRRRVRYIIFRIRENKVHTMDRDLREIAPPIEEYLAHQLMLKGQSWGGFTFTWDVAINNPFEVIGDSLYEWVKKGGSFDGKPGGMPESVWTERILMSGESRPRRPPAFTNQG